MANLSKSDIQIVQSLKGDKRGFISIEGLSRTNAVKFASYLAGEVEVYESKAIVGKEVENTPLKANTQVYTITKPIAGSSNVRRKGVTLRHVSPTVLASKILKSFIGKFFVDDSESIACTEAGLSRDIYNKNDKK